MGSYAPLKKLAAKSNCHQQLSPATITYAIDFVMPSQFIQVQARAEKKRKRFFHKLRFSNAYDVLKLFAMWRKGLRRTLPILKALATVGNQGNPFLTARLQLELFSNYLNLTRATRYLFGLVSVFSGLFGHVVILSPIGKCILNHFRTTLLKVFVLGCEATQFRPNQLISLTSNLSKHKR